MRPVYNEETSQLEMSRAEKILALAMIIFLLIGGAWVFREIQTIPLRPDYQAIEQRYLPSELQKEFHGAQNNLYTLQGNVHKRQDDLAQATREYEFRREEYRVILDKGEVDPARERTYTDATKVYEQALLEYEVALEMEKQALEKLQPLSAAWEQAQTLIASDFAAAQRTFEWKLFLLRALYAVPVFILALFAFIRMRQSHSNYLIFGTALIGFGSFQLIYLFGLYSWHLLRDVAQIAISLMGTALCVVGIIVIRRYLVDPARITKSRLRRGLCPACGVPSSTHAYCIACGEQLQKQCTSCSHNRPVRGEYCPHCGTK